MTCAAVDLKILAFCLVVGCVFTTGARAAPDLTAARPARQSSADTVAHQVRELVRQDRLDDALSLLTPFISQPDNHPTLYTDYLAILHWIGRDQEALQRFEALPPAVPRRIYLLLAMADAYIRTGRSDQATRLYEEVLAADPGNHEARKQMAVLIEPEQQATPPPACPPGPEKQFNPLPDPMMPDADEVSLTPGQTGDGRAALARARTLEMQGRYWDALGVYAAISADPTAQWIRILARLGATSLARQEAAALFPDDAALGQALRQQAAMDHLRWEEADKAVALLASPAAGRNEEDRFARCVALARAGRTAEAVATYEAAVTQGRKPADWARWAAAQAYQQEQWPEKALALYDEILARRPDLFEARLAKFHTLQTLRRWDEADALLVGLKADTPPTVAIGGTCQANPAARQLALAEAWYFTDQDRLPEAQAAFIRLLDQAPADPDARNGLAHTYLWRGWSRRALAAFEVMDSWDATYQPSQTGRAMALEASARPQAARELAARLTAARPHDRNVQRTRRDLDVAQMRAWHTAFEADREEDGAYDTRIRTELSAPLRLNTRLNGYLLWRRTWDDGDPDEDDAAYFRRAGVGLDHIFKADWRVNGAFSVNYDDGREPGLALRIDYTPTDVWSFGLFGDTFSTDVARRARLAGIEARLAGADLTWRQSEWRQAGAGYTRSRFSDANERDEWTLDYQQNLWVKHDWRMRLFVDLHATRNSLGDQTAYFNPRRAWDLSLTHMTEQTVWRLYQKAFVHRLFVTIGNYSQVGYGNALTGALRYEQEHDFSDSHALRAGIGWARNVYDGEPVNDLRLDMEYQWRF